MDWTTTNPSKSHSSLEQKCIFFLVSPHFHHVFTLFFHLFVPRNVGQFRLAVRGHSLLVLDDSGSRIALTEAELLGLEIIAKAGSEGIPPMIGLKVVQPQDRDGMGWDGMDVW